MTKTSIDFEKPIKFNEGWSCCVGKEQFVIVFDNGARWAVCTSCKNAYIGSKWSLFIFNPDTFVIASKCDNCGLSGTLPCGCTESDDYEEIFNS